MFKQKFLVFPLILALLISAVFVTTAAAQEDGEDGPISIAAVNPPPQTSFALIQNLSATQANVTIQFWTENTGGSPAVQDSKTIAGNSAINVNPLQYTQLPSGWRGSMVVQSDQPVVATVVNYGATTAHSIYEGFDTEKASSTMLLPSVHWNPAGQESVIAIQNIQSSDIDVRVTYFDKNGTAIRGPDTYTIPGNVSRFLNAIEDCAACPGGPNGTAGVVGEGSARVEAVDGTSKVAVTVVEYVGNTAYAYDGVPTAKAGREFLLPSIHRNPNGQFSFSLVQNTSTSSATDVTIEYRDPSGAVVDTFTVNIPQSGSFNFITVPGAAPEDPTNMPIEGSAKITSSDTDVVVSVVETVTGFPYSYNGFRVDSGNTDAQPNQLFPSVHRNPNGQFSFLLVANPGGSTANCDITFTDNATQATNNFSKAISGNGSFNFITVPGAASEDPTNLGNEGSARLNCDNGVVGVVVETVLGVPGVYEAFGSN